MGNDNKGLYRKYDVRRVDGKKDPPGAQYFVLRVDNDPHALQALLEYASSVSEENPNLASDIRALASSAMLGAVAGDSVEGARIGRLEMVKCGVCEMEHWVLRLEEGDNSISYRCLITMQAWTRLKPTRKE